MDNEKAVWWSGQETHFVLIFYSASLVAGHLLGFYNEARLRILKLFLALV